MSQSDYNLLNQLGANFRAELNTILQSSQEKNSGLTEPATTFAYQWWADTTTGLLKLRNAANTAWITVMNLADAVNASQVVNAPAGNIAALTVQAAINELDAEKAGLALANDFTKRQTWQFGANIASASTITLGTDGNAFHITGSATTNDFTHITGAGPFLLITDGTPTFTHAAGVLETNTGADITSAAGDRFRLDQDSDGTTWLLTQLGAAAGSGGLASLQVFTSSGTYTKPVGLKYARVRLVGGGGGGSGWSYTSANGSGGGGGGYAEKLIAAVSIGATETITVGGGGAGGAKASGNGGGGGTTSFGALLSATGGGGGMRASRGGVGGVGSGGDINSKGGGGGGYSSTTANAGWGGDSVLGGGGYAKSGSPGIAGGIYGGGGSGGSFGAGGAGAAGIVIVEEIF